MLERVRYVEPTKRVHVEAFTDGYAYDDYSRLYLLSAAGRESNVKAVTAAVINGARVEIVSDDVITVTKSYGDKYRVLSSRLPSGFLHQVVLSDAFLESENSGSKLIYVGREEDAARVVYEAVKSSYPVPLIPEWSEWLYRELRAAEMLSAMAGNRAVVELNADEDALDELVSEGVRSGEIGF